MVCRREFYGRTTPRLYSALLWTSRTALHPDALEAECEESDVHEKSYWRSTNIRFLMLAFPSSHETAISFGYSRSSDFGHLFLSGSSSEEKGLCHLHSILTTARRCTWTKSCFEYSLHMCLASALLLCLYCISAILTDTKNRCSSTEILQTLTIHFASGYAFSIVLGD